MKRAAIYYHTNFGRNDGAPLYYTHNLKKIEGLEVVHLKPEGDTSNFGKFDYHFFVDFGEDGLPVENPMWLPKEDGGIKIYVASDTHLDNGFRYEKAKLMDYVYFNQRRAVEEYKPLPGQKVFFHPHAGEPDAYPAYNIIKKWDVVFIGHMQEQINHNGFTRIDALDRLFKEFPNFYYGSRTPLDPQANMFEDAAKKFCQSKIVFNVSIKDDINMRVFETLSTGSFLLTNNIPTLSELFEDGKHLVTYNTLDEMVEKAKYYLEHDEEREAIAKAGHELFMANHTYMCRVKKVLADVGYKTETESSKVTGTMAKGTAPKDDFKKSTDPKPDKKDVLSPVDKGKDFVKAGEKA